MNCSRVKLKKRSLLHALRITSINYVVLLRNQWYQLWRLHFCHLCKRQKVIKDYPNRKEYQIILVTFDLPIFFYSYEAEWNVYSQRIHKQEIVYIVIIFLLFDRNKSPDFLRKEHFSKVHFSQKVRRNTLD